MFALGAVASEKAVKMKDLPPAVQKAAQEQTKGSELKGLAKEVEKGKTFYEAETVIHGRARDLLFDDAGALVEVLTKGTEVTYEARIKKGLKTSEVQVKADGSLVN
jgi:hypothetical protein